MTAGLSTTLSHNSWTKEDWYGFFACFSFCMMVLLIQLSAFHILWQTRFYERIVTIDYGRWIIVPPAKWLAFFMLLNHACISTGLFFLIYNFQHETGYVAGVKVHNPGNFSWVVGFFVASVFASLFPPLLIHAFCNFIGPAILDFCSLFALVFAFAYEINYIRQDTSPQLSITSPAMWLLIYPIIFKFLWFLVMIRAAAVTLYDADYLRSCEEERSTVSERMVAYNESYPQSRGDMSVILAKGALSPDPLTPVSATRTSGVFLSDAGAQAQGQVQGVEPPALQNRHHKQQPYMGMPSATLPRAPPTERSRREK